MIIQQLHNLLAISFRTRERPPIDDAAYLQGRLSLDTPDANNPFVKGTPPHALWERGLNDAITEDLSMWSF